MLLIENQGQAVKATNYWDSEHARAGYVYLSWNAGAGRVLIPDTLVIKGYLVEMMGVREVIVSRGPWADQGGRDAIELMWEDGSDNPFCLHIVAEQCDRLIPDTDQGGGFVIDAWTQGGMNGRWPGRYRVVDRLPCLQPWETH